MHRSEFEKILFEELNIIGAANLEGLHKSIDKSKLWNGVFDQLQVRQLALTRRYNGIVTTFQLTVFLSIGSFRIEYGIDEKDQVNNLTFSYHVAEIARWFKPLYRDRIERGTWDRSSFDGAPKTIKTINKRFNSLLDGIAEWYRTATVNIDTFSASTVPQGEVVYSTHINYLMGVGGRMRLVAQLHKQRMDALGIGSKAGRIAELANQLMLEIQSQLDVSPVFNTTGFNETY